MTKQAITAPGAPKAAGPYSHAVCAGEFVYTSGQLGVNPETGALEQGVEAQTRRALDNLALVLAAAGASLRDVVKTVVFVTDLKDFAPAQAVYASYFEGSYPARSCVQVAALPMGGLVEIEAVAVKKPAG